MTHQSFGTIAALEFPALPPQGFPDIVEELDIAFQLPDTTRRSLIWDSDDIAIIERDNLRVLLGWLPPQRDEDPGFMMMAVGPGREGGNLVISRETSEFIKVTLVEHMSEYLDFKTIFDVDATQQVGTELVDTVVEILQRDFGRPNTDLTRSAYTRGVKPSRAYTRDIASDASKLQQRYPAFEDLSPPDETDDEDERDQDQLDPPPSLAKRLTIYTLGATMLIYTPAVGAALLIYSTLRDLVPEPQRC